MKRNGGDNFEVGLLYLTGLCLLSDEQSFSQPG